MKKSRQTSIIILIYIFLFVNCKISPDDDIIKETAAITAGEITEDIKLNDFIVKPIAEHEAYFVQGKNVLGIDSSGDITSVSFSVEIEGKLQEVVPDDFFTVKGIQHFTVSQAFAPTVEGEEPEIIIKHCKQVDGVITYLDTIPVKPIIQRVEGTEGDYTLSIGDYLGQPISIAERDYSEPMIFIDNFLPITGGCLLSVQEGRGAERPAGLLFWPDGKRLMDKWKEQGRLWK